MDAIIDNSRKDDMHNAAAVTIEETARAALAAEGRSGSRNANGNGHGSGSRNANGNGYGSGNGNRHGNGSRGRSYDGSSSAGEHDGPDSSDAPSDVSSDTVNHSAEVCYVIGHKNPDTDSICSAICYSRLKNRLAELGRIPAGSSRSGEPAIAPGKYIPARAGEVNNETAYVLDRFGVEAPMQITNITTQVSDIEIRKTPGVDPNLSIKRAWQMMRERQIVTVPIVSERGGLDGLITVSDIAHNLLDVYDNDILSKARTLYSNILDTIDGSMVVGSSEGCVEEGKVLIGAANPDVMESYIDKGDIVIVGNRYESQLCAIEMEAGCIIVCLDSPVSKTIRKMAADRGCRIISTPYDAFECASLINQSISIGYFMKRNRLTTFELSDYIDDISEIMKTKRFRDFPILDGSGKYVGMISRRNLLGARGKNVILVDHNERNQCVDGVEHAVIQEIIDHHKIGAVETIAPVFFRNQPLGCTCTIIYQMYRESGIEIDPQTAGLLCSAIISDTLLFRSPTCTPADQAAVEDLAAIAGIDPVEHAQKMFSAAGEMDNKSTEEILNQDFKQFNNDDITFGVGQIISMSTEELTSLADRMLPVLEEEREHRNLNMIFFMLTNVLTERTGMLCDGEGARELIIGAFDDEISSDAAPGDAGSRQVVVLPGVMSRKKQLVPRLMMKLSEREL